MIQYQLQLTVQTDDNETLTEIMTFERDTLTDDTLGLSLDETKHLLVHLQQVIVQHQVDDFIESTQTCSCGQNLNRKGHHTICYQTLFGKLTLSSPRFYTCDCRAQEQQSFSPLAKQLTERTSPERLYLESKWASLMSYGMTSDLINDVLPISTNTKTIYNHTQLIASRLEAQVEPEDHIYIEGSPNEWAKLPMPDMPLTVGIDGGYIREREEHKRKAGVCEVIVGKSIPYEADGKCFAYVSGDDRPKRRLYDLLRSQGMQANQTVVFLSDGGDNVRDLQLYLSPQAEHILDWFHVTMRITAIRQKLKGVQPHEDLWITPVKMIEEMARVKWFLWHGNVYKALAIIDRLREPFELLLDEIDKYDKLFKMMDEFYFRFGQK